MAALSTVTSSTVQRSHRDIWLQAKLQEMGKNSLAELTPAERARIAEEAQTAGSRLYIKSFLTTAAICLLALVLIPSVIILGGLTLLGTLLFTHEAVFIPLLCAAAVASLYGVKQGIEHGPSLLDRWIVEPFRQARQMQEI